MYDITNIRPLYVAKSRCSFHRVRARNRNYLRIKWRR